ncbi:MAG TPA: futalosine hydrolase [Mycobacteriales bacterium]|nr:futalosine hydrolase [Mycobacteriales bacterium]
MPLTLVVTAVAAERDAVADGIGEPQAVTVGPYPSCRRCETDGPDVLVVAGGVGPAAAAAATAHVVATHDVGLVVSMGVAGAFASARLAHGDTAVASSIVAADLGAMSPERFLDLAALGLDGGATVDCPPALVAAARDRVAAAGLHVAVGAILTLSTMTGTAERAAELMGRHGAVAEAMEGAGVAHVAALHALPVLEVRTISNEVGLRDRTSWDLVTALVSLGTAAGALFAEGLA